MLKYIYPVFLSIIMILSAKIVIAEQMINDDISVTEYKPVTIMQGMGKVFPIFKIKNIGARAYTDVSLSYDSPEGLSSSGQRVTLKRNYCSRGGTWATIKLKPGQEVVFNPSRGNCAELIAKTDQILTDYSTKYRFYFKDEGGQAYKTTEHTIHLFAKVISYNKDIIITKYKSVTIMQGMGKVFPIFKIKNIGSRAYTDVSLSYDSPEGLSSSGQRVTLKRNYCSRGGTWATITLKPGQEVVFNPSRGNCAELIAKTDQALTDYSTRYRFYFKDGLRDAVK